MIFALGEIDAIEEYLTFNISSVSSVRTTVTATDQDINCRDIKK